MLTRNGLLEAWIEEKESKIRLNEYQVEHIPGNQIDPPTTICFLEITNEPFTINLEKSERLFIGSDLRAICEIDKRDIGFSIWKADLYQISWKSIWERDERNRLYKSSLKFDVVPTTTDPRKVDISTDDLESIGTISITITPGTTKRCRSPREVETFDKVKGKAMENRGTSDRVKSEEWQPPFYDFKPSGNGRPYHRFIFNYRSRPVLKFFEIIKSNKNSLSSTSSRRFMPSKIKKEILSTPSRGKRSDISDFKDTSFAT
ncbi:uncharacterized protein L201_002813 [Kwoniella dendrophila CBS 6074]|uniref:DUF7918 domain-containing protein n=1 Tax=Kwoniella dendrophila CBS 6074 TaxID=1295534 RepID=A0AAX4JTU7_9TREE